MGIPTSFAWPLAQLDVVPTVFWIGFDTDAFDPKCYVQASIMRSIHVKGAVQKRQAEFFYGRLCAQAALRAQNCDSVVVGAGRMREPVWPEGIVGSITHGGALAAAVVLPSSVCHGIGIDIEQIATPEAQLALQRMVVSAREIAVLAPLAKRISLGILLTLVFSAKESFFKATSSDVGGYFGFDAVEVTAIDPKRCEILGCVTRPLCAAWPAKKLVRINYMILPQGQVATIFAW